MYEREAAKALELTASIIAETGPRLAGSDSCKKAAGLLADEAESVCDSVDRESFNVHPGAFLGFIKVLVILYTISAPLLALWPWVSAILSGLGALILILEFFLYREFIDPFFPVREGVNVIGILEPRLEARRQVIVSGHHDSAHIFNFYVDRPELYGRRIISGIGAIALLFAASLALALLTATSVAATAVAATAVAATAVATVRLVAAALFVVGLALVLPLWRFASREGTPGAGDNLASSAAALEIARIFRDRRNAGSGLTSTRLIFASFDAEEAGLRGARAFAKRRSAEFGAMPTFAYNMDCIYRKDKFSFLTSDINGSVALDAPASELARDLAVEEGLAAKTMPIAFLTGGTDAAELAKAGVRAASLVAMEWSNGERASAYHTPADTVDAVEPAALEAAVRIGVRFVEALEAGRLE